jgi:hypothetical protein
MVLFGGVVLQADRRAAKIKMTHERILIRIVSQYTVENQLFNVSSI